MRNVRWESSRMRSGTLRAAQESQSGEITSSSTVGLNCRSVSLGHPELYAANTRVVRYVVVGPLLDYDVSY
jgi:hypothetical protein